MPTKTIEVGKQKFEFVRNEQGKLIHFNWYLDDPSIPLEKIDIKEMIGRLFTPFFLTIFKNVQRNP